MSPRAIFVQFRGMYELDVEDSEIEEIIKWGLARVSKTPRAAQTRPLSSLTREEAIIRATEWLDGFVAEEARLWDASQIRPEDHGSKDSVLLLSHLYSPQELVCINARYRVAPKKDGEEKVTIVGPGETKTRAEWIEYIQSYGVPENRAGSWIRLNPVRTAQGSGSGSSHCDADVAAWRYLLVESDLLPYELALSVYGKVALPIAAIIDSAGRGPHAWVAMNAQSPEHYAQKAKYILDRLATIGFDPGNSNPSRYSRLSGAHRIIGAREGEGIQELLYLAPHPKLKGIFS